MDKYKKKERINNLTSIQGIFKHKYANILFFIVFSLIFHSGQKYFIRHLTLV